MLNSLSTTVATPRKWPGRDGAAQDILQLLDLDVGAVARRINALGLWMKNHIDFFGSTQLDIMGEGTRIALEILMRPELGRVDEHGNHHKAGFKAGRADQAHVSRVQRAHGGHQADCLPGAARRSHSPARIVDCFRHQRWHPDPPFRCSRDAPADALTLPTAPPLARRGYTVFFE